MAHQDSGTGERSRSLAGNHRPEHPLPMTGRDTPDHADRDTRQQRQRVSAAIRQALEEHAGIHIDTGEGSEENWLWARQILQHVTTHLEGGEPRSDVRNNPDNHQVGDTSLALTALLKATQGCARTGGYPRPPPPPTRQRGGRELPP